MELKEGGEEVDASAGAGVEGGEWSVLVVYALEWLLEEGKK